MIFVVGGNAQGKKEFALSLAGINTEIAFVAQGETVTEEELSNCLVLVDLHALLQRVFEGKFPLTAEQILARLDRPGVVVTCNDVGGGVVPMTRQQRDYRDFVGEIGCQFAARAAEVYRVFAGISVQIKG